MMAIMLEQLGLKQGWRVLEVGAGTGFNAALMGHIVGLEGWVTTIDIDQDIVEAARDHLAAVGARNVTVVKGDGTAGFSENGPYDAIILTVGSQDIAPAWLEQLAENGRLLLPLSLNGPQFSIAFEREAGLLVSRSVFACSFMVLRGDNVESRRVVNLNENKTANLIYEVGLERPRNIEDRQVADWLAGGGQDTAVGLELTRVEVWRGLNLWLALHVPELVTVGGRGEGVGLIPVLIGSVAKGWGMTIGLVGEGGMAFFVNSSDPVSEAEEEEATDTERFGLHIRQFGQAEVQVEQLRQRAVEWDENGRPGTDGMRVRAYPAGQERETETAVQARWHQFVIDWPPEA
jgi:protein-L-isoaspartate(D-aspartate) O-methyltransferase